MNFEWDDAKARGNARKHRVAFAQAEDVFSDPHVLFELDETTDEERWSATGLASGNVLFVVFVERYINTVRIISARRADRYEQDRYYRRALPQG